MTSAVAVYGPGPGLVSSLTDCTVQCPGSSVAMSYVVSLLTATTQSHCHQVFLMPMVEMNWSDDPEC